jgi:tRNA A22 N-methylase
MAQTVETHEDKRRRLVMICFERLPEDLRNWINYLDFNLHDDHILRGAQEVYRCKAFLESGGKPHFPGTENRN